MIKKTIDIACIATACITISTIASANASTTYVYKLKVPTSHVDISSGGTSGDPSTGGDTGTGGDTPTGMSLFEFFKTHGCTGSAMGTDDFVNGGELTCDGSFNSNSPDFPSSEYIPVTELSYVTFDGASMNHFSVFKNVERIQDLSIYSNPIMTNMDGFSNLKRIEESLTIETSPLLNNINGLSTVSHIGYMDITENDSLLNVNGLSGLTSIGDDEYINISSNKSLTSVEGLKNLVFAEDNTQSIEIHDNESLLSLNGLNGAVHISSIQIQNNPSLSSLIGLSNLETASTIDSSSNTSLTNLEGLNKLRYANLSVVNCINLSDVSALQSYYGALDGMKTVNFEGTPKLKDFSMLQNLNEYSFLRFGEYSSDMKWPEYGKHWCTVIYPENKTKFLFNGSSNEEAYSAINTACGF